MNKQIAAFVRRGAKSWIVVALGAGLFLLNGQALAKTAGCPCSPCTCGSCHCGGGGGGGGGGKGGKHDDHHAHHGHDGGGGGGGVSVGGTVDLGGVGQRHREADPFAVSGGSDSTATAHTQENHKTKKKDVEVATTDPFTDIHLTGQLAKGITAKSDANE